MNHGRTARRGISQIIHFACIVVTLLMLVAGRTPSAHAADPSPAHTLYLPILVKPDPFETTPAIWPHNQSPQAHEVALFRRRFNVTSGFNSLQLQVFADTRYELYLDGVFMGRGPARFSQQTHEYDVYDIPSLSAGAHVIAALVQWSPNTRRSESTLPHLKMRLKMGDQAIVQTDATWKAQLSPAWKADAALVHTWQLIGATELLDFNRLPARWMQPDYDDTSWQNSVAQSVLGARSQPRSIPMLAQTPMRFQLQSSGQLLPNMTLVELQPNAQGNATVSINAAGSGRLLLRTLAQPVSAFTLQDQQNIPQTVLAPATQPPITVDFEGSQPTWSVNADWHPDYREASANTGAGIRQITFRNVPASGWPVLISVNGTAPAVNATFAQGKSAGRRLLLGQPQSAPGAVSFISQIDAATITFNQPASFAVIDLGRVVHGRIEADVQGGAGAVIDVGWDERLWKNIHPLPHPGSLHPQWSQVDSWVLDGNSRHMSTIDARVGRYVLIAVWGQTPVQLQLRVVEERYPVTATAAPYFGDARLNTIWRVGRDTAMLNMTDAYADPWRERGQWWGDATVVDAVNAVTFKDNALMRRGLLLMAEEFSQMPSAAMAPHAAEAGNLLDYAMLWVQGVRTYVNRSGDTDLLVKCYPVIRQFMAHLTTYENAGTGLLDLPQLPWWQTAFIDWAAVYNPGGSLSHGQSTPLNAMYYGTLVDAGALATLMNDPAQSTAWTTRAERVRNSLNTTLYLTEQNRYASSIISGNVVAPTLFAQAWPLAYGVTPDDRKDAVANALLALISRDPDKPNVQPYGMYWVLKALGESGRTQSGIDLIKLYYGTLLDRGATTWWETWDAHLDYSKALSHGWGSAPTWFLSMYAQHASAEAPATLITLPEEMTE